MVKSTRFHGEICQISWWNPPDFMVKSARFHEICQISWMWAFGWWSSIGLSIKRPIIGLQFLARGLLISHEICQISWNLHEIWWISGEIHPNLIKSDVSAKTLLIGLLKNKRPILDHLAKAHNFEIQWILWNLVDLMWISCEICRISWNPWS